MEIPVRTFMLVKLEQTKEMTDSGIYIPDEQQQRSNIGTIVRLGELCSNYLNDGTRVKFNKSAGQEVDDGLLLIEERDIISYYAKEPKSIGL